MMSTPLKAERTRRYSAHGKLIGRAPMPEYDAAGGRKGALKTLVTRMPSSLKNFCKVVAVSERFPYGTGVRLHRAIVESFFLEQPYREAGFEWLRSAAAGTERDGEIFEQVNMTLPSGMTDENGQPLNLDEKIKAFCANEANGCRSIATFLYSATSWYMLKYHNYAGYLALRANIPRLSQPAPAKALPAPAGSQK